MSAPSPIFPSSEAEARARERLAAVGAFAALVSHEVRNRLAVVRAALELLEAGLESNLTAEHRRTLLMEFDAFLGDFNLGVDMIRGDFRPFESLGAREVIDDAAAAFRPAAEARGIALVVEHAGGEDAVRGDRRLLRLVILNLLRNARQALSETTSPRIVVRTAAGGSRFEFEVEDNGRGLPSRLAEGLWAEPGGEGEGTAGLGLNLCRDALTLMRGTIVLASPPGQPGARFRVSLPLCLGSIP